MKSKTEKIKEKILELVKEYYRCLHMKEQEEKFVPGESKINYAGRVFNEDELLNLIDASLEFWLTSGRYTEIFEKKLSEFLGVKYTLFVNSGSSANLLAFMALTSHKLGNRAIKRGDEVITVACCFPTTISPIVQYGAIPVFVDIDIPSYNINVNLMKKALSKKTKAVMIAHTLGNPFNVEEVKDFCDKNGLWLIEDNCDALGSKYYYKGECKYTGTFGDIGTSSFYPPHHITTGEGGAVYTNSLELYKILLSMRDWGRDCWCPSGKDNTCKKRFSWQLGDLPYGYDHKYIYSHFGFNLKGTDLQTAIGVAQIDKLPNFINKRRENWEFFREMFLEFEDFFILPEAEPNSEPAWFGFMLTVKSDKVDRNKLVTYLERNKVQTRTLFSGNIIKHPCFDFLKVQKNGYRIVGELINTDNVMNNGFWIGVYPKIDEIKIKYVVGLVREFIKNG